MNIVQVQEIIKSNRFPKDNKFISNPTKKKGNGFYEDEKEDIVWENYIRNADIKKLFIIRINN